MESNSNLFSRKINLKADVFPTKADAFPFTPGIGNEKWIHSVRIEKYMAQSLHIGSVYPQSQMKV